MGDELALRVAVCAPEIVAEGGVAVALNHYLEGMSKEGIDLTVLTSLKTSSHTIRRLSNLKVRVIRLPFRNTAAVDAGLLNATKRHAKKMIEAFSANDIVYIAHAWYPAAVIARKVGIPVVAHAHDYSFLCPNWTFTHQGSPRLPDVIPCTSTELIKCRLGLVAKRVCEGTVSFPRNSSRAV